MRLGVQECEQEVTTVAPSLIYLFIENFLGTQTKFESDIGFLVSEYLTSRKHAYIILTPLNPTFI